MNTYTVTFEPRAIFVYHVVGVEDLSGSGSIQWKMAIGCLIYRLLIITVDLYDFSMCINIFLTT